MLVFVIGNAVLGITRYENLVNFYLCYE